MAASRKRTKKRNLRHRLIWESYHGAALKKKERASGSRNAGNLLQSREAIQGLTAGGAAIFLRRMEGIADCGPLGPVIEAAEIIGGEVNTGEACGFALGHARDRRGD